MKLLLKETIRAGGVRYLPRSVVDTAEIGITDADADVLVRRGTATVVVGEVAAEDSLAEVVTGEAAPETITPETLAVDGEAVAEAKPAAKKSRAK